VSVYWFSRAGPAASLRIYYETKEGSEKTLHTVPKIPMGVSYFPKELIRVPKSYVRAPQPPHCSTESFFWAWHSSWTRLTGNVVFESEWKNGGHFAAHEKPEELVIDVRKMFGKGGKAYSVVPGKDGY
jgi:hypothetical protein